MQIRDGKANQIEYAKSLAFLSRCLQKYYGMKAIILIDEYDVPLENAYYAGFYDEMITFIRSLFESALKTNLYLEFAVITGCLRISKKRIFTGLKFPVAAWSNTSSNSIVKDLIYHADDDVKEEIELLVQGGTIEKIIHEDITYGDINESEDNLWNFLFFTGYLKIVSTRMQEDDIYGTFCIPNIEVRSIYRNTITNWFRDEVKLQDLSGMYEAMLQNNVNVMQEMLEEQLQNTISYMDSKEAFYHGFLLGLLAQLKGYLVKSNREAGMGRYDICIYSHNVRKSVIILEFKLADAFQKLGNAADRALEQIHDKKYDLDFTKEGYMHFVYYGIGFYKKQVLVKSEEQKL